MIYVKTDEQLIEELKSVADRGVRYVRFIDDNFRLGQKSLDRFCRRIVDEGIRIRWMTMIKINTLENADLDLLRQAGCYEVALGLESADPAVLANMNKKAKPDTYGPVIRKILSAGINCSCYFLFGFPGETEETIRRTRDFIKGNQTSIEILIERHRKKIFTYNSYSNSCYCFCNTCNFIKSSRCSCGINFLLFWINGMYFSCPLYPYALLEKNK